jgi:hypothetical protein
MKFVTLLVKSLRIISETLLDFQNKQNQQQCQQQQQQHHRKLLKELSTTSLSAYEKIILINLLRFGVGFVVHLKPFAILKKTLIKKMRKQSRKSTN